MFLPESIARRLPDAPHSPDDMGCSGASVWVYPDCVLKIQQDAPISAREHDLLAWLQGRLPVPELIAADCVDGTRYLLMSRLPGRYLCDEAILDDQDRLADLVAKALRTLWAVNIDDCPHDLSLDRKLAHIERALRAGDISMEYAAPGAYGPGAFRDPAHLFDWVVANRPQKEELVLSHGDCCLPNIFVDDADRISFIDIGMAGVADRWLDIEKVLWSMWANSTGQFGGKVREFDRSRLFRALNMVPDEEKIRYYGLLDNLF